MKLQLALALTLLLPALSAHAQTAAGGMHDGMAPPKAASKPSTELTLVGLAGTSKSITPVDFNALPHITVAVHNAHANKDESYSGVPVKDLLALLGPAKGSTNMQVIIAGSTDDFHVAITLCDINPECRSGQAIVADSLDGAPLGVDGAFKLILTEDKKPARWARNLQSLNVRTLNAD